MNQQIVKVKKLHPDAVIPKYAKPGDAGFDLVAVEDVIIQPGETKVVPTGLAFAIPQGYEIQIRPRSRVSSRTTLRIANSPGTIDSGYRAEVKIIVENHTVENGIVGYVADTIDGYFTVLPVKSPAGSFLIRKGDRIAQGVLAEVPQAIFVETDTLDETERGAGGFGSTGV